MNVLLLLGLCMLLGLGAARLLRVLAVPRVVSYMLAGFVLGGSVLGVLHPGLLEEIEPLLKFALGLIGFMIGGELHLSALRSIARNTAFIVLGESLGAFALVSGAVYLVTHSLPDAIMLGALASATAPTSTVTVLWEFRAKGVLSSMLLAVVALDNTVAVALYALAAAAAKTYLGVGQFSFVSSVIEPSAEILFSLIAGAVLGGVLTLAARRVKDVDVLLPLVAGFVLVGVGLSELRFFDHQHLSLMLTCMAIGFTHSNLDPTSSTRMARMSETFNTPVYVLFFVVVGAGLQIGQLPKFALVGLVYLAARASGKYIGSYAGGKLSGAPAVVTKYLGLALFSQAGVATGLSIAAYQDFMALAASTRRPELAATAGTILNVVTATTFVVQLVGPSFVRLAIKRAGEIGRG